MLIPSVMPQVGPVILTIPGITDVSLPGGVGGAAGAAVKYRWPKRYKLCSWLMMPRSGTLADTGKLRLAMSDEMNRVVTTDGIGAEPFSLFAGSLSLAGILPVMPGLSGWTNAPRWTPLEKIVNPGDYWTFQAFNTSAAAIVPWLGFQVEEILS